MVDEVRAHVADGADAPIHPTPPVERMIDGVIGDIRRGSAKKEIPTESARNGIVPGHRGSQALIYTLAVPAEFVGWFLERLGTGNALWPKAERPIGPNVDFANLANRAGPNVFHGGARIVEGVALVAHLRDDFVFLGGARHFAGFFDGPGQWFLHVHVFMMFHRGECDG